MESQDPAPTLERVAENRIHIIPFLKKLVYIRSMTNGFDARPCAGRTIVTRQLRDMRGILNAQKCKQQNPTIPQYSPSAQYSG